MKKYILIFLTLVISWTTPAFADSKATLTWNAPTTNTDGSPISNLSGYRLYYGKVSPVTKLNSTVIDVGNVTTFIVTPLVDGTWFFAATAYNTFNNESVFSNEVSKVVDGTPPVISIVAASGITPIGATITWTTNEASSTQVEYGLTATYGSVSTINAALVTSHSVALAGLVPATMYNYRVVSIDGAGNVAKSANSTITTAVAPTPGPPTGLSAVIAAIIAAIRGFFGRIFA